MWQNSALRHPRFRPTPHCWNTPTCTTSKLKLLIYNYFIKHSALGYSFLTLPTCFRVHLSTMGSTGDMKVQPHIPRHGVWCPAITFFDRATDTIDWPAQKSYFSYLATTGLAGLVILGTNAEAFLLTTKERSQLIAAARDAVGPDFPLMAGVGSHSTKQTLEFIENAAAVGADYVLCLPPAYFGKATTPAVIEAFFEDVAAASPLPIVIYNFPGVCNGVDPGLGHHYLNREEELERCRCEAHMRERWEDHEISRYILAIRVRYFWRAIRLSGRWFGRWLCWVHCSICKYCSSGCCGGVQTLPGRGV
jgi:Dihydrodipicolinate synthetase family